MFRPVSFALLLGLASPVAAAPVTISYVPIVPTTSYEDALLGEAAFLWEWLVPEYRTGIAIPELTIGIDAYEIDGPDGVLAQSFIYETTIQAGFTLPTFGFIDFDLADVEPLSADGGLLPTLLHETAHVMGFGALWQANGLYEPKSGAYTGASGLAAYRAEFDSTAEFVPVERDFGAGTAELHWSLGWAGPEDELMTGFIDSSPSFSRTTLASFRDLGYAPVPIPLPGALWLGLAALGLLRLSVRRPPRS